MRCRSSAQVRAQLTEKLGLEDHAATACAVQNFMLSLASEGIASKWMTATVRARAPPEAVSKVFDASAPGGAKALSRRALLEHRAYPRRCPKTPTEPLKIHSPRRAPAGRVTRKNLNGRINA